MFEEVERVKDPDTPLFKLMNDSRCLLTELVDSYWRYSRIPWESAMKLARMLYGDTIKWNDVKEMYRESMNQEVDKWSRNRSP